MNCNVGLLYQFQTTCSVLVSSSTASIILLHEVRTPSEEKLPTPMPPEVTATVVDDNPEAYEERHVHAVYDHIASHFSSTRYKVANVTIPHIFQPF